MSAPARPSLITGIGIASVAAAALFLRGRSKENDMSEALISDAPPWTQRDKPVGAKGELIGRTVTVNASRDEAYARWRRFEHFPDFMENVDAVERLDERRSRWTIKGPAGSQVTLMTEITHDVPGERIAWRSLPDSEVETAGEVLFVDAAPGRGTQVQLVQTYAPPAGPIGKAIAKLLQREPAIQARRDLRRFKQLMETGEVTTNASPSARKKEAPDQSRL